MTRVPGSSSGNQMDCHGDFSNFHEFPSNAVDDLIFIRLEGSEGRFQLLVGSSHSHPFRSTLELLEADSPSLSIGKGHPKRMKFCN